MERLFDRHVYWIYGAKAPGHTIADDKFYHKGFLDFKKEIEEEIEKLDFVNDFDAFDKKAQLQAMAIACDAIIIYGKKI